MSTAVLSFIDGPRPDAVSFAGNFPLDKSVLDKLPEGAKVLSANRVGNSEWTVTGRIDAELADGNQVAYFIKCAPEDHGRIMMEGEHAAMSELYKTMPSFVPKPIAWGKYEVANTDTKLAWLHKNSVSPTGKFGMGVTTCQGRTPQAVSWEASWTKFFTKLLKHVADLDFETNGPWEALEQLESRAFTEVIPRLIGALETDGRSVKPCLIHADLWEGNTGTVQNGGDIYIFDSGAFYAHNEMETGDWRCKYNRIGREVYTTTYKRYYNPSEPRGEWDDRNRMYSVYYNVIYSVNHKASGKPVRQIAYDDLYYLIDKYAPFPDGEGPPRLDPAERAVLSAERDHTMEEGTAGQAL